jgi:hypothetical protein
MLSWGRAGHRAQIYGTDTLPQASTCFNRFNLPSYTSYAVLSERLLYAINEGSQGFGFAWPRPSLCPVRSVLFPAKAKCIVCHSTLIASSLK